MYVFMIPLLAAINTRLYHKALITCIISDFLNLVLKWQKNRIAQFLRLSLIFFF